MGRTLPKTTDNSDMYNRAFPVGNTLFLSISWRNCVKLTQFLLVRSKQGLGQARPNKITWKTRKSLKSEVPDGQEIFKN